MNYFAKELSKNLIIEKPFDSCHIEILSSKNLCEFIETSYASYRIYFGFTDFEHFEKAICETSDRTVYFLIRYKGSSVGTASMTLLRGDGFSTMIPAYLCNAMPVSFISHYQLPSELWYGSRLALKHSDLSARQISLLFTNIISASSAIADSTAIMLGLIDPLVLRIYRRMGLRWEKLRSLHDPSMNKNEENSKVYLCSIQNSAVRLRLLQSESEKYPSID